MYGFSAYLKNIIDFNYRGRDLRFYVSQSLFSSHDIDLGTKRLLRTLETERIDRYQKVLDLGCGYGPIGISLKNNCKSSLVHMVDKDALAIEFSKRNLMLNNLKEIFVYGSLGYDDVIDTDFDLIVSNIPAKIGELAISHVLEDSRFYLRPKGKVAVVVIDAIGKYVENVLKSNKNIKILFYKRWPGHLVFHYEFLNNNFSKPKQKTFDKGIYNRGKQNIYINNVEINLETFYGLPEFNTASYETELILDELGRFKGEEINKVIILNPNQGIIPVAITKTSRINEVVLVDRDLEALRASKKNLITNGFSANNIFLYHQVGLPRPNNVLADLVVGTFDEKDNSKVHLLLAKEMIKQLSPGKLSVLASSSTPITRIQSVVKKERTVEVIERRRSKGKSLIILRRKS